VENESLNSAIQKQMEANKELFCLLQKQELQEDSTNEALRVLKCLQKQLNAKHELELEKVRLKGELEVRKHMVAEEDTELQQDLDKKHTELKDINDEIEYTDDLNQTFIVKEKVASEELEDGKKEMIRVHITIALVFSLC
jgi:hypothetical protein